VIVQRNDPRTAAAITSALAQPGLCHVIVADGGSDAALWDRLRQSFAHNVRVRFAVLPGTVAATRARVLAQVDAPSLAFLDADQQAPGSWLPILTAPIDAGGADQTCGPTRPTNPPRRGPQRYVASSERDLYEAAATDPRLFPAGNSAWRTAALRSLGGFDPRMGRSGEDFDLNLRARRVGTSSVFVPGAWVWHDQSHLDTYRRVLARKFLHFRGAAYAYLKNGSLRERGEASARRFRVSHWLDLADFVLKPLALAQAHGRWRTEERRRWPLG
jgi:hypothetical protein